MGVNHQFKGYFEGLSLSRFSLVLLEYVGGCMFGGSSKRMNATNGDQGWGICRCAPPFEQSNIFSGQPFLATWKKQHRSIERGKNPQMKVSTIGWVSNSSAHDQTHTPSSQSEALVSQVQLESLWANFGLP